MKMKVTFFLEGIKQSTREKVTYIGTKHNEYCETSLFCFQVLDNVDEAVEVNKVE